VGIEPEVRRCENFQNSLIECDAPLRLERSMRLNAEQDYWTSIHSSWLAEEFRKVLRLILNCFCAARKPDRNGD